jgi:outer membrane protein OmpA-like peptidoglycan-associated protein
MPLLSIPRRGAGFLGAALLLAAAGSCGAAAAAAEADGAPSPPAEAPPVPAMLPPDARPPAGTAAPGGGAALEALAEGRWRIRFAAGREELSEAAAGRLEELGRRLAEGGSAGRVTVEAQSSGPEADVSAARRLSLGRALSVKAALASGGLLPTRIDLRPLGRTPEAVDAADILPPPAAAAGAAPRRAGPASGAR